jgi:hypothetical protein
MYKKIMRTFLLTSTVLSATAFADNGTESILDFSGEFSTRARHYTDSEKTALQGRVVLQVKARLGGGWQIIGVAHNGFDSFYDTTKEDRTESAGDIIDNFGVKNLYIENEMDAGHIVQLGALKVDRGLKQMTALNGIGWVDGARVKIFNDNLGEITITAGSMGDFKKVSISDRDFDFNFVEIKLEREVFESLLVEVGYERHDNIDFLEFASKYEVELASNRLISILGEALYDVDNGKTKASIGVETDLGELFTGEASGVSFEVRHNYMSEDFSDRGTKFTSSFTTPGISGKGAYGTYVLKGKFNVKSDNIFADALEDTSWRVRVRHEYVTGETYYEMRITKKF